MNELIELLKNSNRHFLAVAGMALGLASPLYSSEPALTEVRPIVEEMLEYHVEHKEYGPELLQRTFKLFIDQFDPAKIYLTAGEVETYIAISEKKAKLAAQAYGRNRFPDFLVLNELINKAIVRNTEWREELQRAQIVATQLPQQPAGESYLDFAENEVQLKDRLQRQLVQLLWEEKMKREGESWDPELREKIGSYWNKRFVRHEGNYAKDNTILLARHILKAAARSLDAHSAFFTEEEALEMRASLEKQFDGIGVVLKEGIEGIVIADLVPNGPASRSGQVAVGDVIA